MVRRLTIGQFWSRGSLKMGYKLWSDKFTKRKVRKYVVPAGVFNHVQLKIPLQSR